MMARAAYRPAILLMLALGACTPKSKSKSPAERAEAKAEPPAWAQEVQFSDAQKAVLEAPLKTSVKHRAKPIYPDLARFAFVGEKPIDVPNGLLEYANLVSKTIAESPRLYAIRTGPSSLANLRMLFGPEPDAAPDPWQRVAMDSDGKPTLVFALPSDKAQAVLESEAATGPDGIPLVRQTASQEPDIPGINAMIADASLAAGDLDAAESAARSALAIDPYYPHACRVLAEVALRRNDIPRARQFIARALALYPTYPRAWEVAEAIVGHEIERAAIVEQPFIAVNGQGAIVVVACNRPFCSGYAACKAAFRYEPRFRASVLHEPAGVPYHLSATEEAVCLQAGLGAHLKANNEKPGSSQDPTAELLVRLASEEGLTAFGLFEVLGSFRPEWLRVAPRELHIAIVRHIQIRVLGKPSNTPQIQPTSSDMVPITAKAGSIQPGGI